MDAKALFKKYRQLLRKIDRFCAERATALTGHLKCRKGCAGCCRQDLAVLPVEFYALQAAARSAGRAPNGPAKPAAVQTACVFLHRDRCALYSDRPVICRTHGLPLLLEDASGVRRDCCPKNFAAEALARLPAAELLHLERLNTMLSAVNMLFCRQAGLDPQQRLPLSHILDRHSCA